MAGKIDITTDNILEETEYKRQGSIDDENFIFLYNKINELSIETNNTLSEIYTSINTLNTTINTQNTYLKYLENLATMETCLERVVNVLQDIVEKMNNE